MENAFGIFDTWFKLQKEFIESWINSQNEFMDNWLQAAKKLQDSFMSTDGKEGEAGQDIFNAYNMWYNAMVNASRTFTGEALKMQEIWKTSFEKAISEFSKQGTGR